MKKIFVFGSNLAGVHGAGAARYALLNKGAIMGQGIGLFGESYALPTKDERIQSLTLQAVQYHVDAFIGFAMRHPDMVFQVTRVGCGLAGFTDDQVLQTFLRVLSTRNIS